MRLWAEQGEHGQAHDLLITITEREGDHHDNEGIH